MDPVPMFAGPAALYVEDRSVNVLLMQALFERLPARLVVARDGAQALQLVRGLHPRLLLLDINLPDCCGTDLLAQLRTLPGCHEAHAVAVTAETGPDFRRSGFAEIWVKPLNLPCTLVRLGQLLGIGRVAAFASTATPGAAARFAVKAAGDLPRASG
jgi:CheY-like chemotaxis protein